MKACCWKLKFIMWGPACPGEGEKKKSYANIKRQKTTALGTFLLFHSNVPHGPLRRKAKVVSLGLGIPAVGEDEVHEHLSPGTGKKEPPGRDHSTSLGCIRSKQKIICASESTQCCCCCSLIITIIIFLVLLNNCSKYKIMPRNQYHGT